MRAQIGLAGISLIIALGSCAHRAAETRPANGASTVDGDVPSKRRGVIVPSDPAMGISGSQSTTGTEGGRIDDGMGKSVGGGGSTP